MIIALGLIIPFVGTVLGAACVYLLRGDIPDKIQRTMLGFASGVMIAASVWSLLIPAMDLCGDMGRLAFLPALIGFGGGIGFLFLADSLLPHLHIHDDKPEGISARLRKSTMMFFAVTLHNLPEGMAVGIVIAASLSGETQITTAGAIALAIGIAIQNFPEGAIVSLPLKEVLGNRHKAFGFGVLSGVVEPVGAVLIILLTSLLTPWLPYILAFAAGAMVYVVVEELLPEASDGDHTNLVTVGFSAGFALMMVLDSALG